MYIYISTYIYVCNIYSMYIFFTYRYIYMQYMHVVPLFRDAFRICKAPKKKAVTRFTENLLSGGIITDRSQPKSWQITKVPPVQWHSAAILQFKDLLLAGNLGNFTECFWCFWMSSDGLIWKWDFFTKQNCLFLTFSSDWQLQTSSLQVSGSHITCVVIIHHWHFTPPYGLILLAMSILPNSSSEFFHIWGMGMPALGCK